MPKVSLTAKLGGSDGKTMVQKGPAPDYSMLLEMKRRSIMVADAASHGTTGRKNTGIVVDNMKTRGFDNGPTKAVLIAKGARLGFFKF